MVNEVQQASESIKAATQKLIAKQNELLSMLGHSQIDLQRHDNHPKAFLDELLEEVKSRWNQNQLNHSKICEDPNAHTTSYCTYEWIADTRFKYSDITRAIYQQLESRSLPTSPSPQTVASATSSHLPRMSLPTFSGSYLEWQSFRDLFISVVHQNSSLTDVQRLHYLRTCLKNEVLARIAGFPLTGEEYAGAWASLRERYGSKRVLVYNHVDHLVSIPALKRDNASELRHLCDSATRVLRSLETLGRKEHLGNDISVHLIVQRLTPALRKDWEKHLGASTSPPLYTDLMKFLESSMRALDSATPSIPTPSRSQRPSTSRIQPKGPRMHHATASNTRSCASCQGPHYIGRCPDIQSKTPEQRKQVAIHKRLCLNCLSSNHPTKGCKSEHRCFKCNRAHHSLLHTNISEAASQLNVRPKDTRSEQDVTAVTSHLAGKPPLQRAPVLLATAMVALPSPTGRCCRVRALLDQGPEASFIAESAVQRLRLRRQRDEVPIHGIASSHAATARSSVKVGLSAASSPATSVELRAFVLPRLTDFQPPAISSGSWTHLRGLELADPFYASPAKIEVIIGADVYASLLRDGVRHGKPGSPSAQRSILGWILSGPVSTTSPQAASPVSCHLAAMQSSTSDHETSILLRRFWEIEEIQQPRALTRDEQSCEEHFATTHRRTADGRYVVRLPFKEEPLPDFRTTRAVSLQRLQQLERRLARSPQLASEYSSFLQEYASLGHMSIIEGPQSAANAYYMPHHAVVRESSSTTKLCVVFSASQKSNEGISLNDCLFTGPALQKDLFGIILRWRAHSPRRRREPSKDRVEKSTYGASSRLRAYTVTYGTAAAPYLAIRTLQQLADDERSDLPLGAAVLRDDFYVDDLLSGAADLDTALAVQGELIKLLQRGGFRLRKWTANDPALLQQIPSEDRLQPAARLLQPGDYVRTLGLHWNSNSDTFHFQVSPQTIDERPTKRKVFSAIARLFDPLGWLAPVIVKAKILMQRLWAAQLSWDQPLQTDLADEWRLYQRELPKLSDISIPRWTNLGTAKSIELHGFCDASINAYAASVYVRVVDTDGSIHVSLLAAKSKVAPLKQLSIPRLELCGALVLARLLNTVAAFMDLEKAAAHAWTDSRIVLAWLQGHPTRWTCFIANRVSEIQTSKLNLSWHHVPSKDNPADCASRGLNPSDLPAHSIWWQGPAWLRKQDSAWPQDTQAPALVDPPEERRSVKVHTAAPHKENDLLARYSSIKTLVRITAYCRRFLRNTRTPRNERASGFLTPQELSEARSKWIRQTQRTFFEEERKALVAQQPLAKRSPLIRLNPFLDKESILRVGGRLRNSPLPFDERHPAIIPRGSQLASLLIAEAHLQTLHGGTQLTWSQLLRRYWLLGARTAIRAHVHRCIVCFRSRARCETQQMGDLPAARTTPSRPFSKSGVDYAGPIQLRALLGRGQRTHKGYIALFICLATKAVHLEAVTDCSTAAFLAAFRRFVARRGHCAELWSDNETNFTGADHELRTMFQQSSSYYKEIAPLLANDGTLWRFIPPSAPHFGGIWEAGVKSTKHHLRRIVGNTSLTYEELSTLLAQIEACLNSRPISPLHNDPDNATALTPGYFLIGTAPTSIPEHSLSDVNLNRLSRWQLVQQMTEHFWTRWSAEYLHHLQQRSKWEDAAPNLTLGTVVLIKDERLLPTK